jgi:hypothetical protein
MFGKGKKNRQSVGTSKSQNILEMFQSLVEDPDDPNSVINMEGKTKQQYTTISRKNVGKMLLTHKNCNE